MAVAMMGGDEKKPTFHDFLGTSCGGKRAAAEGESEASASVGVSSGGRGLISGCSDLGSAERQGGNSFEVFQFHGRKSAVSGLEIGSILSGRKRNNSDSAFMGASDSLESSRLMKRFGKEVVSKQPGRSHDNEMMLAMQPPRATSLILHPPLSSRPDSLLPKWERSMLVNPAPMVHYPSRFAQGGTYIGSVSSSCAYKDASAGAAIISHTAADEGSRTGIKGSGIVNMIDPSSEIGERNSTVVLPCGNRPKDPQAIEPESCNLPRRHTTRSASWQMTIFYAGQAHVFDDVRPNKADLIMALAGSNGGSWSTTYSPKSSVRPPASEGKASSGENEMRSNLALSVRGDSDRGLSQDARVPVTGDLPSLILGGNQGSRSVKDARLTPPASEPNVEGRRDT